MGVLFTLKAVVTKLAHDTTHRTSVICADAASLRQQQMLRLVLHSL